jgi:hypothetical protein
MRSCMNCANYSLVQTSIESWCTDEEWAWRCQLWPDHEICTLQESALEMFGDEDENLAQCANQCSKYKEKSTCHN